MVAFDRKAMFLPLMCSNRWPLSFMKTLCHFYYGTLWLEAFRSVSSQSDLLTFEFNQSPLYINLEWNPHQKPVLKLLKMILFYLFFFHNSCWKGHTLTWMFPTIMDSGDESASTRKASNNDGCTVFMVTLLSWTPCLTWHWLVTGQKKTPYTKFRCHLCSPDWIHTLPD